MEEDEKTNLAKDGFSAMTILVDTSVIIDFLRRKEKERTWWYELAKSNTLMIALITHTELYAGSSVWTNRKARQELHLLFSIVDVTPLSTDISLRAAEIRARYRVDLIDALIAATALAQGVPLATLNRSHFKNIAQLKLVHPPGNLAVP